MLCDFVCFDLCGILQCGLDVEIDVNVIIEGNVLIGNNVVIGVGLIFKDCEIDDNMVICLYSVIEGVMVGENCIVGLFICLCFGVELCDDVYVGNFVEMKNVCFGEGLKVNYLIYFGDVEIGKGVNVGVGVIICNYDGVNKYKIVIGDDVFVGFDCQFVVFVIIGNGVIIGAGIILMKNVVEGELVIICVLECKIVGWQCLVKKK